MRRWIRWSSFYQSPMINHLKTRYRSHEDGRRQDIELGCERDTQTTTCGKPVLSLELDFG